MDRLQALAPLFRVIETGSFTAAARALGRSQPQVSRDVATLERALGVRLLTRTTRRVKPTDAGRLLYERGGRALRELFDALDETAAGKGRLAGPIRVAVPAAIARRLVLPAAAAFLAQHKEVTLELLVSDRVIDFVEAGIDFAVRVGPPTETTLTARALGVSVQRFVAAPAYLRRRGKPAAMEDLARHELLLLRGRGPSGQAARLVSDDVETLHAAALAGHGVAVLPAWLVGPDLAARRLTRLLPEVKPPSAPVLAVFPSGRQLPVRVRALLEAIAAAVGPQLSATPAPPRARR